MRPRNGSESAGVGWLAAALCLCLALPGAAVAGASSALLADSRSDVAALAFEAQYGGIWFARRDPSDQLRFIWGSGVPLVPGAGNPIAGPEATRDEVVALVRDLVAATRELHGVDPTELVLNQARSVRRGEEGSWAIDLDRQVAGVPVVGARVFARLSHGNLVQLGFDEVFPIEPEAAVAQTTAAEARSALLVELGSPSEIEVLEPGRLELHPEERDGGELVASLRWRVAVRVAGATPTWTGLVDASSGQLVELFDATRETTGSVSGMVHPRTATEREVLRRFPHQKLLVGGVEANTEVDGSYSGPAGAVAMTLDGRTPPGGFVIENNEGPGAFDTSINQQTFDLVWDESNSTAAERNAFYHLQQARLQAAAYGAPWTLEVVPVEVNRGDGTCNAAWTGSELRFRAAGGGCANTAEIADVVAHEWTHSLLDSYGDYDDAGEEAACDVSAWLLSGDPIYAPGLFELDAPPAAILGTLADHTALRDASQLVTTQNIAERCSSGGGCTGSLGYECHCEGLILSGAAWDLQEILTERWGTTIGPSTMRRLFFLSLSGWRGYFSVAEELLVVDDDDGDLANGTPHACFIHEAFTRHGLPSPDLPCSHEYARLRLVDHVVADVDGDGDGYAEPGEVVDLELTVANIGNFDARGATATISTSSPGVFIVRAEVELPDIVAGGAAVTLLPARIELAGSLPCGAAIPIDVTLRYDSLTVSRSQLRLIVGEPGDVRYAEGFEAGAAGWDGRAGTALAGDWVVGQPRVTAHDGDVYQPGACAEGALCLFTGQNGAWYERGRDDVDRGTATAVSAVFDLTGVANPVLELRYWFTSLYVRSQTSDVFEIELTNGVDVVTVFRADTSLSDWRKATIPLAGTIEPTATMQLRFHATDAEETLPNLVEAAIDELRVVEYDCSSDPGCAVGASLAVLGRTSLCVGERTVLTASAAECPSGATYQWLLDGSPIQNATGPSYVVPPVAEEGSHRYEVEVTCDGPPACQVRAGPVTITVTSASAVIAETEVSHCRGDVTQVDGSDSRVSGCIGGAGYEWLVDGVPLAGEIAPVLNVPDSIAPGTHTLELRVSCLSASRCASTATAIPLHVTEVVASVVNPGPIRLCSFNNVTLDGSGSYAAGCAGGASYQWRVDGVDIAGATSPTLVTPPVSGGVFEVTLEVSCASLPSCARVSEPVVLIATDLDPPEVRDNSLRLVRGVGDLAWLTWERWRTGVFNVHRTTSVRSLPQLWLFPPVAWTDDAALGDEPPTLVGRPWYYQVFGADCDGQSVP